MVPKCSERVLSCFVDRSLLPRPKPLTCETSVATYSKYFQIDPLQTVHLCIMHPHLRENRPATPNRRCSYAVLVMECNCARGQWGASSDHCSQWISIISSPRSAMAVPPHFLHSSYCPTRPKPFPVGLADQNSCGTRCNW
jgi:hypothetical protein